uniref:hypothetical protein n=1 Tax=Amycolatopsis sp. CA-082387 TaxID=3239918 RepID=UPI003F49A780
MWLLYVFLGLVVAFCALIIILVREGSSIGLAITVPAAVIAAAGTAVLFLRNLFVDPPDDIGPPPPLPLTPIPPAIAPPPRELPDTDEVSGQEPEVTGAGS